MFDRAARAVIGAFVASSLLSGAVSGQDGTGTDFRLTDVQRQRLELELAQVEARIEALQLLQERVIEASMATSGGADADPVREVLGPFEFWGPPHLLPAALNGARRALGEFDGLVGDPSSLPPLRVEVHDGDRAGRFDPDPGAAEPATVVTGGTHEVGWLVGGLVDDYVLAAVPGSVVAWSGGQGWNRRYRADDGLRVLLGATDPQGIRCLQAGDLDACHRFLGLAYDGSAGSRLALLEEHYPVGWEPDVSAEGNQGRPDDLVIRCMATERRNGSPDPRSACLQDIAERESATLAALPAHAYVRGSLVAYALRMGGGEALGPLEALPPEVAVGTQLAAIAGTSEHQLVRSWQSDASLGAGLFRSSAGDRPGPLALFWAGGFALLALRSTRWRLG